MKGVGNHFNHLLGLLSRQFNPLKSLPSVGLILWLPTGLQVICGQELKGGRKLIPLQCLL